MPKNENILPKEFVEKEFTVKKAELPKAYIATVHFYKDIFARVNLPSKLVAEMGIKNGDRLRFELRKEKINNRESLIFCSWVEK